MGVLSAEPEVLGPSQQEMVNSTECQEETATEHIITPKRNVKNISIEFIHTTYFLI